MARSWRFPHNLQLGVLPIPVTATLISICTAWILQVKNKHAQPFLSLFDRTSVLRQTGNSAECDRVPVAASLGIPTASGTCRSRAVPLPHCLLCLRLYILPGELNSHDAVPGFHLPTEAIQWEYIVRIKSNPAVLYNTRQLVKGLFTRAGQEKWSIKCHRHYLKHFHQMFSTF